MIRNKIRRNALIIQNPGIATLYRAGVLKDAERFTEYLRSDIGGAWELEEVTVAPIDCTVSWIEKYFKETAAYTDYYLIIFTGHGNYAEQIGPRCYLRNDDWFNHAWIEEQVAGVPTLFLTDSCQVMEKLNEGGILRQRSFSATRDSSIRSLYRRNYDNILRQLPPGMFVTGSSVSPGESAYEDPNVGGHYFISLLKEAMRLNQDPTAQPGVYCIGYIHALATEDVNRLAKGKQTPYLIGYSRTFQPPFMVKL